MKAYTKTKIAYVAIPIVLAICGISLFIWYSHLSKQSVSTPVISQLVQKAPSKPHTNILSSKKSISAGDMNKSQKAKNDSTQHHEVSMNTNSQESSSQTKNIPLADSNKENNGKVDDQEEYYHRQFAEAREMYAIQAREQIPVLVERFKALEVETEKQAERSDLTEAEITELNQKKTEMWDVQRQIMDIANKYHSTHQEERAVYPEGWLGPYLKEAGLVYGDKPL